LADIIEKTCGVLEGLIVAVIGLYMGLLVLFGDYWRFLNPKFKWLTGATAVMLIATGIVATIVPNKKPGFARIIVFLIFLRVLSVGNLGISLTPGIHPDTGTSRLVVDGIEYIKINLAELYVLSEKKEPVRIGAHYAVRGIVKRSRTLDSLGEFALIRNVVFCCLADSVGMGFRVQHDGPEEHADGQWVEVYGTLSPLTQELPDPEFLAEGLHLTVLNESYELTPAKIVSIKEPEIPFIFDFEEQEPYAY
jgi:hypothetical protein